MGPVDMGLENDSPVFEIQKVCVMRQVLTSFKRISRMFLVWLHFRMGSSNYAKINMNEHMNK